MKQTIKLDFCGFWKSFDKNNNLFTKMLSPFFNILISDDPDFVICSNRGQPFEYMKYECVRIMFMGEPMSPDFTVFDYCIGFDFLDFGDRYFRLPLGFYRDDGKPWIPEILSKSQAVEIFKSKKYFCNFIYGHASCNGMREKLFQELGKYKNVVSPGSFLSNMGGKRCSWKEKFEYLKYSKFTIAVDSVAYPGFETEKIVDPFEQHSVPIYYGNPHINHDFNEKAFVWCQSENDIERVIEQVIYLDTHDDAYIAMLMQNPLREEGITLQLYQRLQNFLLNIFKQTPDFARRRIRHSYASNYEKCFRDYMKKYKRTPKIIHRIKSFLKP